ncbi:MAG: hypothetical protein LBD21_10640 [Tannerellaceae bacterium]|nr:hypothetical protein [Tannerellaceae bacterium]
MRDAGRSGDEEDTTYDYNICDRTAHQKVLRTLTDVPGHIGKYCFQGIGDIEEQELFYIALDSSYPEFHAWLLLPCEPVPDAYRQKGLPVRISGHVTDTLLSFCADSSVRFAPVGLIRDLEINYKD